MKILNKPKDFKSMAIAVLILGVAGTLIYFLGTQIYEYILKKKRESDTISKVNAEIVESDISLTPVQISSYVDKLYAAMKGWGTDEEAIFSVFKMLRTRSDLLELKKIFGIKGNKTLDEWIVSELNSSEREKLNQILVGNKINYSFFGGQQKWQ